VADVIAPWSERVARIRVNTESVSVALKTKRLLEMVLEKKFTVAVSTKNFILLDCDNKERLEEFLAFCAGICKQYAAKGIVYETQHGYHFVCFKFLSYPMWRHFYTFLKKTLESDPSLREIIDYQHVDACLRRGYATLRLTQIRRVALINELGEVRAYE